MRSKYVFIIVALLSISVLISGCSSSAGKSKDDTETGSSKETNEESQKGIYQTISPEDAKTMLDENIDIILLDVRTQEEYDDAHIPGSTLVPLDQIENEIEAKIPDKDTILYVYCRSGRRSKIASNQLIELGYNNVYDLGGINDWPYEKE